MNRSIDLKRKIKYTPKKKNTQFPFNTGDDAELQEGSQRLDRRRLGSLEAGGSLEALDRPRTLVSGSISSSMTWFGGFTGLRSQMPQPMYDGWRDGLVSLTESALTCATGWYREW